MPVEWVNRQALLYEADVARSGLLQKLCAVFALLLVFRVILKLTLHVKEHETNARSW